MRNHIFVTKSNDPKFKANWLHFVFGIHK